MAERYTDRIKEYCEASGIEIPAGFYRYPASRYAIIDTEPIPPKLVAKTWFNQEDVLYFLKTMAAGRRLRILHFKDRQELVFEGGKRFNHGNQF